MKNDRFPNYFGFSWTALPICDGILIMQYIVLFEMLVVYIVNLLQVTCNKIQ
jgi:hypothetical protein